MLTWPTAYRSREKKMIWCRTVRCTRNADSHTVFARNISRACKSVPSPLWSPGVRRPVIAAYEEQPTRLRILWGVSPQPSISRFRRLAYPNQVRVTSLGLLVWKSHGCPMWKHIAVGTIWVASKPSGLNISE